MPPYEPFREDWPRRTGDPIMKHILFATALLLAGYAGALTHS